MEQWNILCIHDALYSTKSRINLSNFKDIHHNEFCIETVNKNDSEYLYIAFSVLNVLNV